MNERETKALLVIKKTILGLVGLIDEALLYDMSMDEFEAKAEAYMDSTDKTIANLKKFGVG